MKRSALRRAPSAPPVEKTCETCGRQFKVGAAAARRGEGRYCSRDCMPKTVMEMRECAVCDQPFEVEARLTTQHCSRSCANKARIVGEKPCSVCGEPAKPHKKTCGAKACVREAGSRAKRGARNPRYKSGNDAARRAWLKACEKRCRKCKSRGRLYQHHVVYAQHVRRLKGDVWDVRNSLSLCFDCHNKHHHSVDGRLALSVLRPENFEFARESLGDAMDDYFRRYYEVDSPIWSAAA